MLNGVLADGPVGVPNRSSASKLWSFGPGVPAMLTMETRVETATATRRDDERERRDGDASPGAGGARTAASASAP